MPLRHGTEYGARMDCSDGDDEEVLWGDIVTKDVYRIEPSG